MTPSDDLLICTKPFVVGSRVVRKGETFSPDHDLVQGRESFFGRVEDRTHFGTAAGVEAATADPGEKRAASLRRVAPPARSKTPPTRPKGTGGSGKAA